jgi:hypothetical protein
MYTTSIERKLRMPHIRGIKGEVVVVYCEPLITKEMEHHRLSQRVNKMMKKTADDNASIPVLSKLINRSASPCLFELLIFLIVLFTIIWGNIQYQKIVKTTRYWFFGIGEKGWHAKRYLAIKTTQGWSTPITYIVKSRKTQKGKSSEMNLPYWKNDIPNILELWYLHFHCRYL